MELVHCALDKSQDIVICTKLSFESAFGAVHKRAQASVAQATRPSLRRGTRGI